MGTNIHTVSKEEPKKEEIKKTFWQKKFFRILFTLRRNRK